MESMCHIQGGQPIYQEQPVGRFGHVEFRDYYERADYDEEQHELSCGGSDTGPSKRDIDHQLP
jgi:hypothetical protein